MKTLKIDIISKELKIPVDVIKWNLQKKLSSNYSIGDCIVENSDGCYITENGYMAIIASGISDDYDAIKNVYKLYQNVDESYMSIFESISDLLTGLFHICKWEPEHAAKELKHLTDSFCERNDFFYPEENKKNKEKKIIEVNLSDDGESDLAIGKTENKYGVAKECLKISDESVIQFSVNMREQIKQLSEDIQKPFSLVIKKVYQLMRECGYDFEKDKKQLREKYNLKDSDYLSMFRVVCEKQKARDLFETSLEALTKQLKTEQVNKKQYL